MSNLQQPAINNFTTDQNYLTRAILRRSCVLRDLNYLYEENYPEQAASEVIRLDAAIVDIKTRLTEDEIKACS